MSAILPMLPTGAPRPSGPLQLQLPELLALPASVLVAFVFAALLPPIGLLPIVVTFPPELGTPPDAAIPPTPVSPPTPSLADAPPVLGVPPEGLPFVPPVNASNAPPVACTPPVLSVPPVARV